MRHFRCRRIVSLKSKVILFPCFAKSPFSACVTSILRLHSIYLVSYSNDVTWDNVGAALWSAVEINCAIICASLPVFKAIVSRIFPRLLGKTLSGSQHTRSKSHQLFSGGTADRRSNHPFHMMDPNNSGGHTTTDVESLEMKKSPAVLSKSRPSEDRVRVAVNEADDAGSEEGIKVETVVSWEHEHSPTDRNAQTRGWL